MPCLPTCAEPRTPSCSAGQPPWAVISRRAPTATSPVSGITRAATAPVRSVRLSRPSAVERDNLTSRQSIGRLVRKTLSHSKKSYFLRRHLALEDAVFNFVRPHQALRIAVPQPTLGRKWQQRTPAMAAELTDHIWSLEELLSYRVPPPKD
jgi:hypothetical protein